MHECPECYQVCSCGGDIDDIVMENAAAENLCTHCPWDDATDECDDDEDYNDIEDEDGVDDRHHTANDAAEDKELRDTEDDQ